MLRCDLCGERYPNNAVYLNDQGQFRCACCLGWMDMHPVLAGDEQLLDEIVHEREACG